MLEHAMYVTGLGIAGLLLGLLALLNLCEWFALSRGESR